ncbi:alanine dehydrogenase [Roseimarinus sediminis]|uniref:alanine dehydrogenase n=1 Tax=Roseimarinus sediminis TaxID=1610899 RepID=UPI003D1D4BB9
MNRPKSNIYRFEEQQLMPAEEKLEVRKRGKKIVVGIPANMNSDEPCLPLTPQAVEMLIEAGHEVTIESNAGKRARYTDLEYAEAGAVVTGNKAEVYQCDFIFKVAPFTHYEIDLLRGNQVLFSMLQMHIQDQEAIRKLIQKKVTAIAYEYLKDEHDHLPVMQSLSEISGIVSMTVASELLSVSNGGKGVLFGGITGISPASVLILGADTAAEYAARTALGLGAEVKIFDHSVSKLRTFEQRFPQKIFTSLYYPRVLEKAINSADVILGAQPFNTNPRYIVPRDLIRNMKSNSVIIDLNASQGGCFETTRCTSLSNPTYTDEGVIHYCVPNITARVSRTTTIALSNIFASVLIEIGEMGGMAHYIKNKPGFRDGVYCYNGILTNKDIGDRFHLPTKDLGLLLAAF